MNQDKPSALCLFCNIGLILLSQGFVLILTGKSIGLALAGIRVGLVKTQNFFDPNTDTTMCCNHCSQLSYEWEGNV